MIWTPTAATVAILTSATAVTFGSGGGLARVVNTSLDTTITFTIGASGVTNSIAIPLSPGQDIIIGTTRSDTHAIASAAGLSVTPGKVWS